MIILRVYLSTGVHQRLYLHGQTDTPAPAAKATLAKNQGNDSRYQTRPSCLTYAACCCNSIWKLPFHINKTHNYTINAIAGDMLRIHTDTDTQIIKSMRIYSTTVAQGRELASYPRIDYKHMYIWLNIWLKSLCRQSQVNHYNEYHRLSLAVVLTMESGVNDAKSVWLLPVGLLRGNTEYAPLQCRGHSF